MISEWISFRNQYDDLFIAANNFITTFILMNRGRSSYTYRKMDSQNS